MVLLRSMLLLQFFLKAHTYNYETLFLIILTTELDFFVDIQKIVKVLITKLKKYNLWVSNIIL